MIPRGLCQCGCGEPTKKAKYGEPYSPGEPRRFLANHHLKLRWGNWIAPKPGTGGRVGLKGYMFVAATPGHSRSKYYEHRVVVELVLGKKLRSTAVIHHVNGDRTDNRHSNLVVCNDNAYHALLHRRQAALKATGSPNSLRCYTCGEWGLPGVDLTVSYKQGDPNRIATVYHAECRRRARREREAKKRALRLYEATHG